jgi:hypothetical protein
VYARRQFCADLEVYRPPEPLWNPRLREAADLLAASRARHFRVTLIRLNLTVQQKNVTEKFGKD